MTLYHVPPYLLHARNNITMCTFLEIVNPLTEITTPSSTQWADLDAHSLILTLPLFTSET